MKINVLERTLGKSSKEILRGKDKLKNYHLQAAKQYNSMCEDLQTEMIHSPIILQLKERQHSRKDVRREHSGRMVRSKSRQIEKMNQKKDVQTKKHDIGSLYSELMAVKAQYKKLKGSYQNLAKQKVHTNNRAVTQIPKTNQSDKNMKEVQKYHQNMQILQFELQRIRKQCLRVVQTEKFKNKRLEQIIQEKELTIAYLRGQLDRQKKWPDSANTTNNQTSLYCNSHSEVHYVPSSANCSLISNIVLDQQKGKEEDSLCFSCDPSKELDSVNSLYANNEKNLKKDRFIVQPNSKIIDPFKEPSQCLTFQQRDEQINQTKQIMRLPPRQVKKDQNKPKAKSNKKLKIYTHCDENINKNGRNEEPHQKQLILTGGFTKQRKKVSSSRKRN